MTTRELMRKQTTILNKFSIYILFSQKIIKNLRKIQNCKNMFKIVFFSIKKNSNPIRTKNSPNVLTLRWQHCILTTQIPKSLDAYFYLSLEIFSLLSSLFQKNFLFHLRNQKLFHIFSKGFHFRAWSIMIWS